MGAKGKKRLSGDTGLRSDRAVKATGKVLQSEMLRVDRDFANMVRCIAKRQRLTVTEVTRTIALDMECDPQ